MPVYALLHAKKEISARNPALTDEGLIEFQSFLEEGHLGSILQRLDIRSVCLGYGRRFEQTYLAAQNWIGNAPVQIFPLLGNEFSRINFSIEEKLSSQITLTFQEKVITGPGGEVLTTDDVLWIDDPMFEGITRKYVERIDKHLPGATLLICTKSFIRSFDMEGAQESKSGALCFLCHEKEMVVWICKGGELVRF